MLMPRNVNIDAMALNAPPNSSGTLQVPIAIQAQRSKESLRQEEAPRQMRAGIVETGRAISMDEDTAANYANALAMYTAAEVTKMAGVGQHKAALTQTLQQTGMSPEDLMRIIYG